MTIFGYMETINISTLKAKISASLKRVREGETIIVFDRDTPIAEIIPYKNKPKIKFKKPKAKFQIPKKISVKIDPLLFLMEERKSR